MTLGARLGLFFGTVAAGAAADLATKALAFSRIREGESVSVIDGFLRFVLARNEGAAFSMLRGHFEFFLAVSIAALALLVYFSFSARRGRAGFQVALGLVGAGVVGNLYDRLAYGHVRDFIGAYIGYEPIARKLFAWFGTNEWPIFNVADAFICVGAGALLVSLWREERRERRAAAAGAAGAGAGANAGTGRGGAP